MLLAAVAVLGAASCSGDDDPITTTTMVSATVATSGVGTTSMVPAPPPSTTAATSGSAVTATISVTTAPSAQTMLSISDEHLAFTAALPDDHAVVDSGRTDLAGDGACVSYWWQLAGDAFVEAWPASCEPGNADIGNGAYGHYRTPTDAPSAVPTGEVSTALGPAATFEQVYYECTNSCDEWPLDVAVIELSEPVDPEYPTVAVIMTGREATGDDLGTLLDAFGAG